MCESNTLPSAVEIHMRNVDAKTNTRLNDEDQVTSSHTSLHTCGQV